jgi:predicted  nucleic acid-binding Zn-ribbon protein
MRAARDRLERAAQALEAARRESSRIDAALAKLRDDEHAARERARSEPAELIALEALRRARRLRGAATELERQRDAYGETIRRLEAEALRIEDQLLALGRTRHLLKAREERAEALHAVVGGPGEGLRGAIERWEAHVASVEATGHAAFEVAVICADPPEDEADLLAELNELRRNR